MKRLIKKCAILPIACFSLCIIIFSYTLVILLSSSDGGSNKGDSVIKLWQIDAFEGGKGSRAAFLTKLAAEYEKQNNNCLIMVTSHTYQSAVDLIAKGEYPNIISYGFLPDGLLDKLVELSVSGAYSAKLDDKDLAYPWCRGAYALISKSDKVDLSAIDESNTIMSVADNYTQISYCAYVEGVASTKRETSTTAYVSFIRGKYDYLLGTQRDAFRLDARKFNYYVTPLNKYCDMYQYVSILSSNVTSLKACYGFVNYLLSEPQQLRLSDLGLFSVKYKVSYDSNLNALSNSKPYKSISPFCSFAVISELTRLKTQLNDYNTEYVKKIEKSIVND